MQDLTPTFDPDVGLAYFCYASAIYVTSFWMPTLIKGRGIADPLHIGLLTAIPYIIAMGAMYWTNAHADRTRERRWHAMVPCAISGVGLLLSRPCKNPTSQTA